MDYEKPNKDAGKILFIALVLLTAITAGLTLLASAEQEVSIAKAAGQDSTADGTGEIEYFLGSEAYEEGFLLIRLLEQKGTAEDMLLFPETVGVLLHGGTYDDIPATWESDEYNPEVNGQYRFDMKLADGYEYDVLLPYAVVIIGPDPYAY